MSDNIKDSFRTELNEILNKMARYESLLVLMDEHPPKNKIDKDIVETLYNAFEKASDIMMELERKMNHE